MMMMERSFLFVAGGIFSGFAGKIRPKTVDLPFVYFYILEGMQLCGQKVS